MTWWMWAVVSNVTIMVIEYLNRTAGFVGPFDAFKITFPLILIAQIGLFYCWRDAPQMLLAWTVFTLGNCILRLISATWFVGEVPTLTTLVGVALIMAGGALVKVGG